MDTKSTETNLLDDDAEVEMEGDAPGWAELSAEGKVMYKCMLRMQTPALLLDRTTKVLAFNTPGKIQLQKRGRLLRRRLDHLFPATPWEEMLAEAATSHTVVSRQLSFVITRGLEKKTKSFHCVFMPLELEDGPCVLMQLLPMSTAASATSVGEAQGKLTMLVDPLTVILGHLEMLLNPEAAATMDADYHIQKIARQARAISTILKPRA